MQEFSNSKNSKIKTGLSLEEVRKLQARYGPNIIEEKFQSRVVLFLKKFIGPIPLMIEAALVLSMIAGKWDDFSIILVLLGVNIMVDFLQENKAHKALQALKNTLSPTAVVLREGVFNSIEAKELVPGDIIKLVIGDIVPADAVLVEDKYLYIDQASITGESLPVEKKKDDTVYTGSIVQKGVALVRVTAIGRSSFVGKSANLVAQAEREEESHFQKAVLGIGKFLMALSSVLIVIVFIALMSRGDSLAESVRFVLVLAVASIPVALPAVLSVTMAIGAAALAKRNAIVSNFKSIEELAGVDQLCVDKTGTLTKNKIAVSEPKVYGDFKMADLFTYALLASDNENRSTIEEAIYVYAKKNNLAGQVDEYKIDEMAPFDPVRKMTEVTAHTDTDAVSIVMGAPQVVIKQIGETSSPDSFSHDVEELAQNGFRTLFVARKSGGALLPVGIIPLLDPPRDDSKSTIFEIKKRGVDVKMLTGDNTAIARFIANILGVGTSIMKSSALHVMRKTKAGVDKDDMETIAKTNVFAEVIPEDKYHIVDVLQKHGHIVAMTGDGVNDAPALKKADIGIAVSGASPAARSAADIVLLDNGLSVIKDAVDNARMIFAR
ncbi:MAG TPA: plasma-membrane proton-efflux P-type ATPase, partial [Candidatus Yonathbacteria bacterium]|nr:plasma-membrane proton-efflux P-type ATPase [Candidatus Yonathbacteria bacterium]